MRTAIITGGTGGLGTAVTRRFLDDGWRLVVPWVAEGELERVERREGLELVQADLFDEEAVRRVAELAGPSTRAVVNLVGGFAAGGRLHETPVSQLEDQLRLNLRSAWLVTAAGLPAMLAAGEGAVVCVSSRTALQPFSGGAAYAVAKRAVLGLVDALHVEYAQDGIRANAILPSVIDTPANRASMPDADPGDWVTPEQLAATIAFLCDAASAATSGAHLPVYGEGVTMALADAALSGSARALRGGIDLGGTKIQALVLDQEHAVVGRARAQTPRAGGPAAVTEAILAAMGEALAGAGVAAGELSGVGVGSPGAVDRATGSVANARNLPDWIEPFPLAERLSAGLEGIPVVVGNDVATAIQGEYELGAGRPYDSVVGVWWGTGVGGGLILDHRRWAGRGFAGEFGHQVIHRDGARCGCGNRGCVEAYAGRRNMEAWVRAEHEDGRRTALFTIMEERGREVLTSGIWWRAVSGGDRLATKAVERAVDALGAGIASAVNLLDVPAVVVGGGMGDRFFGAYEDRLTDRVARNLFRRADPPRLLPSALGDDGGALGASLLLAPGA